MNKQNGRPLIVFDLDNTIYDFSAIFSPAFRGMVNAISHETGISKEKVIESAKRVMEKHLFLEYPFLIEEMDIFQELDEIKKNALVKLSSIVFNKVKGGRIEKSLYPNVVENLEILQSNGFLIVALTNAPLYQSFKRISALGLVDFFRGLIATRNFDIPSGVTIFAKKEPWKRKPSLITKTFDRHERKPSIRPFEIVMETFPIHSKRYMVGDNIITDLRSASLCGFETIWARYGTVMEEKNEITMVGLTPSQVKKSWQINEDFMPNYTIDSFGEITKILNVRRRQGDLFTPE